MWQVRDSGISPLRYKNRNDGFFIAYPIGAEPTSSSSQEENAFCWWMIVLLKELCELIVSQPNWLCKSQRAIGIQSTGGERAISVEDSFITFGMTTERKWHYRISVKKSIGGIVDLPGHVWAERVWAGVQPWRLILAEPVEPWFLLTLYQPGRPQTKVRASSAWEESPSGSEDKLDPKTMPSLFVLFCFSKKERKKESHS